MSEDGDQVFVPCIIKQLPAELLLQAVQNARLENPHNVPAGLNLEELPTQCERLAADITSYWGKGGVKLTVAFLDNPPADLRERILSHMNAWNKTANVTFVEVSSPRDAKVRVSRSEGGYWSYLGTDLLSAPLDEQTMNLEGFTMKTPDSEFYRVVRHEAGHTLGFPHEHMRQEIIRRLDRTKTIRYFGRTQGWSEREVLAQILTPLEEKSLIGTPHAEETSIMCYDMPAEITKDGRPVVGGRDITAADYQFAGLMYPKSKLSPDKKVP